FIRQICVRRYSKLVRLAWFDGEALIREARVPLCGVSFSSVATRRCFCPDQRVGERVSRYGRIDIRFEAEGVQQMQPFIQRPVAVACKSSPREKRAATVCGLADMKTPAGLSVGHSKNEQASAVQRLRNS